MSSKNLRCSKRHRDGITLSNKGQNYRYSMKLLNEPGFVWRDWFFRSFRFESHDGATVVLYFHLKRNSKYEMIREHLQSYKEKLDYVYSNWSLYTINQIFHISKKRAHRWTYVLQNNLIILILIINNLSILGFKLQSQNKRFKMF